MESFENSPTKITTEIHQNELLEKANGILENLGLTSRYKKIKEQIAECENLRNKKVIMVDDIVDLMKSFAGDLTTATNGNASFLLHSNQTEEIIIEQILAVNPEIILMDKNLANGVSGINLVRKITQQHPEIICIGFSSESSAGNEFISAGARGFVDK